MKYIQIPILNTSVARIYLKMLYCVEIDFKLTKEFVIIAFNNDGAAYHIWKLIRMYVCNKKKKWYKMQCTCMYNFKNLFKGCKQTHSSCYKIYSLQYFCDCQVSEDQKSRLW